MEQLRYYSQYFGEPHLKLQRIESVASRVMTAKASLSVTVTEFTLRHMFPHLVKQHDSGDDSKAQRCSLYNRLLGQRFQFAARWDFCLTRTAVA